MTKTLNSLSPVNIAIWRGAALPIIVRNKVDGAYEAYAATLAFRARDSKGDDLFTLAVGTGITLATYSAVANAEAIIQFSESQSLLIPKGSLASYELLEGTAPNRSIVLAGLLVGEEAR